MAICTRSLMPHATRTSVLMKVLDPQQTEPAAVEAIACALLCCLEAHVVGGDEDRSTSDAASVPDMPPLPSLTGGGDTFTELCTSTNFLQLPFLVACNPVSRQCTVPQQSSHLPENRTCRSDGRLAGQLTGKTLLGIEYHHHRAIVIFTTEQSSFVSRDSILCCFHLGVGDANSITLSAGTIVGTKIT